MQIADIGSWKVLYLMWIIPLFSIMTADRGRRGSAQQVWPELLRTVMENCLRCYHSINLCTFNCFGADCRTHEGMNLLIRVIIVSSHACPGREMQFGVEMWLQTWNWMTDHRKICASDDDGGDIDHSLTLNVNVSWKTIFEIIREAVCSVTSQKSDTGSGIGFQGGVLRVGPAWSEERVG